MNSEDHIDNRWWRITKERKHLISFLLSGEFDRNCSCGCCRRALREGQVMLEEAAGIDLGDSKCGQITEEQREAIRIIISEMENVSTYINDPFCVDIATDILKAMLEEI